MQRVRVIDRDIHQVTEFARASHFLKTDSVPPGISTIYDGEIPIDLLISPSSSATTTIFFFHGAIEPHFTLPVLSGLGLSGGLEANRVFISDPTLVLDEKLMLSWYAGNMFQPELQDTLRLILEKVAASLDTERAIFFGGSGGGFAALYYASFFPNSLALVFNPQTNIAKYSGRAVQDYTSKAFHVDRKDTNPLLQIPANIVYDLCAYYTAHQNNSVAYIQNLQDKTHIRRHLKPFLESIHPETEVLLLSEHWRDGHSPPPKELLSSLLNGLVTTDDWYLSLVDAGFQRHIKNVI